MTEHHECVCEHGEDLHLVYDTTGSMPGALTVIVRGRCVAAGCECNAYVQRSVAVCGEVN